MVSAQLCGLVGSAQDMHQWDQGFTPYNVSFPAFFSVILLMVALLIGLSTIKYSRTKKTKMVYV